MRNYSLTFEDIDFDVEPHVGNYKLIIINNIKTDYLINSKGFVVSLNYKRSGKPGIIKEHIKKKSGYHVSTIIANHNEYKIHTHRLVAEAFIPKIQGKDQVNHIHVDNIRDKYDNSVDNLEWVTAQENATHAKNNGLTPKGKRHYMYKYTDKQVRKICKLLEKNKLTMHEIAKKCDVKYEFVTLVRNGKIRTEISSEYDLSKYNIIESKVKGDNYKNRNHVLSFDMNQLEKACELFEKGQKSTKEISEITGIHYSTLCKLRHKRIRNKKVKSIMDKYNW